MEITQIKSPLLINARAYPQFYDGLDRQLRLGMAVTIGTLAERFTVTIVEIGRDQLVGQVANFLFSEKSLEWGSFIRFAYENIMFCHMGDLTPNV